MKPWMIPVVLFGLFSTDGFAADSRHSVFSDLSKDCTLSSPGPNQIQTCPGPAGFQATIHQTPMGEQLTLENTAIAFSAAVIRCSKGQRITQLGWRLQNGKPFAALIGYRCTGLRGQSAVGGQSSILVQGLKGFEEYGHEVPGKRGRATMAAAERLADGWLEKK